MTKVLTAVCLAVLVVFPAFAAKDPDQEVQKALNQLSRNGYDVSTLRSRSVTEDELGMVHVRFDQFIDGVRVFEGDLVTHARSDGSFKEDSVGKILKTLLKPGKAKLTADDALAAARAAFGENAPADAELVILPSANGNGFELAWSVDIDNTATEDQVLSPRREQMMIDAHTGAVLNRWSNLQTTAATGIGTGYYAGAVAALPVDQVSATSFTLKDIPNNAWTTDYNNKTDCFLFCTPQVGTVYTSTSSTFGTNGALTDRKSIGVDAHHFSEKTLSYFSTMFGRNGIDNQNNRTLGSSSNAGKMVSRTHYGSKYNNAFWNGKWMTYGDGDGTTYNPFDAVDVVGHEMTHGITERTAKLTYKNESGAANESFSDIFGTAVEYFVGTKTGFNGIVYAADYKIGEDLYIVRAASKALRHMDEPHMASNGGYTADDDPDHYSERYTGTGDSGGVHINSGIQNKVFYLLAAGGTHHKNPGVAYAAIGLDKAARISYRALTVYCTASSNFSAVRVAFVNAANDLYGANSAESNAVASAWTAVGVN